MEELEEMYYVVSVVQQDDDGETEGKGGQTRLLALQKTRGQRKHTTRDYILMRWHGGSEMNILQEQQLQE